jgi:hypothetical protein
MRNPWSGKSSISSISRERPLKFNSGYSRESPSFDPSFDR